MGKKTKTEKSKLNFNLEVQMNLATDLASRNPIPKPYWEKNPNVFAFKGIGQHDDSIDNEFKRLFHELTGISSPFRFRQY